MSNPNPFTPSFLPAALRLQKDLRRLADRRAPVTAFPDLPDLITRAGSRSRVPGLVRRVRDLTHLATFRRYTPNPVTNPHHLAGYAIPYVCTDTEDRLIMSKGVTLETIEASLRELKYQKTRGWNFMMMWENLIVTAAPAAMPFLQTTLHFLHTAYDDRAGFIVRAGDELRQLIPTLSTDEAAYLRQLLSNMDNTA